MNVKAIIDRIEKNYAIIKLAEREEIKWPINLLPADYKAGSEFYFKLETTPSPENVPTTSFKEFLNDILGEDRSVT